MGHRHRRAGPAGEPHRRDGRVLHLAVEDDVGGQSHRLANRPEERQQQLDPMAAEVEHRSAAGDVAPHEPVALLVRLRVETLERVDLGEHRLADLSRRQDLAHAGDDRIEVPIVGDAELDAAWRAHAAIIRSHSATSMRHRLLAEDVLAGFRRGDGLRRVEVHGRRNVDRVDSWIA